MKAIINGKIIKQDTILEGQVLVYDKKIVKIIPKEEFEQELLIQKTAYTEILDASEDYVSPGFIDLHIHGAGGKDIMDGELDALQTISKVIAANGTTGFLPTTITMPIERIRDSFEVIKQAMQGEIQGARILGAHMEGPFINKKYKGAQNETYIKETDFENIRGYEEVIKILTYAPELDRDLSFLKKIKENTVISVSLGHSNANYEEAMLAIQNGVSRITHLFNAMIPFGHRNPGIIGAAFNQPVSCEIIADNIHIHPGIYQTLINIKGKDKIILITDSIRAGCMKDGISELGGQKVIVKEEAARLEDGTLAGSILTLNRAIQNIYENTSLTLFDAVALASINPAKDIGIESYKGSLDLGKDADITIFDEAFQIKKTIVEGRTIFEA